MGLTHSTKLVLEEGEFTISYHATPKGDCLSINQGNFQSGTPLIQLHSSCLFGEALHALDCDCGPQLTSALRLISRSQGGVVVYRYAEGRGIGLENKIRTLEVQRTQKLDTVEAFKQLGFDPDPRQYDVELRALRDLKVSQSITAITQNPNKLAALKRGGFTIVNVVSAPVEITQRNRPELLAKKNKLGHKVAGLERHSESV
jgi:GTP cyclohydrolase II